jgi:hypothetical protein
MLVVELFPNYLPNFSMIHQVVGTRQFPVFFSEATPVINYSGLA